MDSFEEIVVALGVTAATSLFRKKVTLAALRGSFHETPLAARVVVTYHPSAVLRSPRDDRAAAYAGLVTDLRFAASLLG